MEELRRNCMTWLERTNPLRGLSISRAGTIYDNARVWGSPWLQYVFNEIEQTDPVLMTCVERRASALAGLERKFVARASADRVLADEQRDALDKFAAGIDNFTEALEHLDGAFFQGFAHVQPIWDGQKVQHCQVLKSWNFLRDGEGRWLWNPNCRETPNGLETVEGAWLVSLARKRFIDWPCLNIYIRKALGHRDYGRFIERHGVPHAVIIMPPGTDDSDKPKYIAAASRWQNGQDIALPAESSVNLAAEARGADPFTPFIELQDKYTVLLSTGGTLTSLAQADTGSLAGGAQMEVWREIVARDGVAIADALNRCLFRRYLELAFPGQPVAAEFQLSNEKRKTPEEVADLAGKLKTAGYSIDQEELQEAVGFTLVKDELPADRSAGGMNLEQLSALIYPLKAAGYTIQKPTLEHATGLKLDEVQDPTAQPAAPIANKEQTNASPESEDAKMLKAFAKDMSPAGKAVAELLKDLDAGKDVKESAASLVSRLPSLLPEDPAMTAVIAEAMAKAFGAKVEENKVDENGVSHSDENGQFDGGEGGGSAAPKKEEKKDPLTTINEWDDPKTVKMKQRYIKMIEAKKKLQTEISQRSAHVEGLKNDIRRENVEKWKRGIGKKSNKDDANGMSHSDADGQFDGGNGGTSDTHTPEEKKRIAEYEASTDQRVVDFVKKMDALGNDERNNSWISICDKAPHNLTDKIKSEVGVDCSGFGVELTGSHVKHVDNRHGSGGAHDQSMADPAHYGRINYVINHFDSVEALKDQNGKQVYSEEFKDRNNKPSPVVNVKMRIDGTVAVQQAVPDSKLKKLRIVSVRIEKGNGGR